MTGAAVATAWALAGAVVGTALGIAATSVGLVGAMAPVGTAGVILGLLAGLVAFWIDRRRAARRPPLLDGKGRWVRPMAAWVLGTPLVVGGLGLMGLLVLGSIRTGSLVPAALSVVGAYALVAFGRPLVGSRALARAVVALEAGDVADARDRLTRIERSAFIPHATRTMAAVNLGLLALFEGRLDEAAGWYERGGGPEGRSLAATGLALVRTLQGRWGEAEELLDRASMHRDSRSAHTEIDGVQLLLVLRRDGPEAARERGERMVGPGAGSLFLAALAAARSKAGDPIGARLLRADPGVEEFLQSGFGEVVPELRELRGSS